MRVVRLWSPELGDHVTFKRREIVGKPTPETSIVLSNALRKAPESNFAYEYVVLFNAVVIDQPVCVVVN